MINMRILRTYAEKLDGTFDTATHSQQAVNAYHDTIGGYWCIPIYMSMLIVDGFEATYQICELGEKIIQNIP